MCAVLLWAIGSATRRAGGRYVLHWKVLSVTFVFLSIDEAVSLHEKTLPILRGVTGTYRLPIDTWVLAAAPLVIVFALAYVRFLLHLPRPTVWLLLIATGVYVAGALGSEYLGEVVLRRRHPERVLAYQIAIHVEELLEMLAVVTLIYLLSYLTGRWGNIRTRREG